VDCLELVSKICLLPLWFGIAVEQQGLVAFKSKCSIFETSSSSEDLKEGEANNHLILNYSRSESACLAQFDRRSARNLDIVRSMGKKKINEETLGQSDSPR